MCSFESAHQNDSSRFIHWFIQVTLSVSYIMPVGGEIVLFFTTDKKHWD